MPRSLMRHRSQSRPAGTGTGVHAAPTDVSICGSAFPRGGSRYGAQTVTHLGFPAICPPPEKELCADVAQLRGALAIRAAIPVRVELLASVGGLGVHSPGQSASALGPVHRRRADCAARLTVHRWSADVPDMQRADFVQKRSARRHLSLLGPHSLSDLIKEYIDIAALDRREADRPEHDVMRYRYGRRG